MPELNYKLTEAKAELVKGEQSQQAIINQSPKESVVNTITVKEVKHFIDESEKGGVGSKVSANEIDSGTATNGQVLTANGSGGVSYQNVPQTDLSGCYKKPQASVTVDDGDTISDNALKALIQAHQPIQLNGYVGFFSNESETVYQYYNIVYDSTANKNHLNVVTIDKTTWVATFHISEFALVS